jgi:anti-sigma factor RsiW
MTTLIDEADADILERFLDGELSDVETDAVTRRVADEPLLATALEQARSLRDLRASFFQSLEPGDAEARTLVARAKTAARRIDRGAEGFDPAWRWIRQISAVAAMIMIGFASAHVANIGWSSLPWSKSAQTSIPGAPQESSAMPSFPIRLPGSGADADTSSGFGAMGSQIGLTSSQTAAQPPTSRLAALWRRLNGEPIASQSAPQISPQIYGPGDSMTVGNTLNFSADGSDQAASTDTAGDAAPRHFGSYQVELRDESDRTVAVQHFDSLEEAKDFVETLQRFDNRARTAPVAPPAADGADNEPGSSPNNNAVLIHDQF